MARIAKSVRDSVARIKRRYQATLCPAEIGEICRAVGHRWREGVLSPVPTLRLFLLQILCGNTSCSHVRLLAGAAFTEAAYCLARQRIPLAVFKQLVAKSADVIHDATDQVGRWLGHRVVLLDGSSFSMPDTKELDDHFGHPSGQSHGCSFPVAHLMLLCDLVCGTVRDVLVGPLYTSDVSHGRQLHRSLHAGDVLVGDRGFGSWGFVAIAQQSGLEVVVRAHQSLKMSFTSQDYRDRPTYRRITRLGRRDQIIEWYKPDRPRWMSLEEFAALPNRLLVRVHRYTIRTASQRTRDITIITTLLDVETYSAASLQDLYRRRWEIELTLRHLKTTMGLETLRCKTVAGVTKELYMYIIAYNMIRQLMLEIEDPDPAHGSRVSFKDAMRFVTLTLLRATPACSPDRLSRVPVRRGRVEPRKVKRRPKRHWILTEPRPEARKRLLRQQDG